MTEKRFRVQEHCLRSSYGIEAENWLVTNDNHSVALNDKAEAHMVANMCNDVIDVLNALHEENEQLKQDKTNLHRAMSRDRVKYNQFKDKVFCCIDAKIKLLKDCYMTNEAKILEDLKEEISDDRND